MDQNLYWIVAGIFILLAAIGVAGIAIWVTWQKARQDRLGDRGKDYHRLEPPQLNPKLQHKPSPEIQWGDEEQPKLRQASMPPNTGLRELPLCPLCKHPIDPRDGTSCPNCDEKYHQRCWIEYNKTCVICGKGES